MGAQKALRIKFRIMKSLIPVLQPLTPSAKVEEYHYTGALAYSQFILFLFTRLNEHGKVDKRTKMSDAFVFVGEERTTEPKTKQRLALRGEQRDSSYQRAFLRTTKLQARPVVEWFGFGYCFSRYRQLMR